ncbi:tRNA (guanosine(46)-N7)-methyltransferase TrmB [Amphibiibacter pelophylacis]|uniref:tRNA (Guanosine(46)-N7)-methyltransferase TrmB n=1 Tax=Amphibiibacter pelophylacis TaxID=1799477 RepID=A0ACC6NZD6_9BURK
MTDAPTPAPESSPGTTTTPAHHRRVRTFVLRAGRMGSGQVRALEELGPRFVLPHTAQPPDWAAVFGRQAPRVLEIGFGMGHATAHIAALKPEVDFIGAEVHTPGVGSLLKMIGERSLGNVRIVQHDAIEVLEHMIPPASLAGVHIFFPDPWHKARHHKRRLIQPEFVAHLARHVRPGGYLHLATDWQPYAEQMRAVMSAAPDWHSAPGVQPDGYSPRPDYRPETRFEARGLRLGHGVWDLVLQRNSG